MGSERELPTLALTAADFLGLCSELLSQGGTVRVQVEGVSMSPYLLPGDLVWIEPAGAADLRVGQVALYEREGRPIVHQLAGRARRRGRWLMVFRSAALNTVEQVVGGEAVLGRITALERGGARQSALSFPIGLPARVRAWWRLLMHGRASEGSWLHRAPDLALRPLRRLVDLAVAFQATLRSTPGLGALIRRLLPPLEHRLRIERVVSRPARRGEAYLLEAYLANRRTGWLTLSRLLRREGPDTWWVGVEVRPWYRRRGVAGRLLAEIASWARELGIDPLYAAIREGNRGSLALFEQAGYVPAEDAELERVISTLYAGGSGPHASFLVYVRRAPEGPAATRQR